MSRVFIHNYLLELLKLFLDVFFTNSSLIIPYFQILAHYDL